VAAAGRRVVASVESHRRAPAMKTATLVEVLTRADADFRAMGRRFAIVGGLAVSARGFERTTHDVDVAIAVKDDQEAELFIRDCTARGYTISLVLEHISAGRLATVRLLSPLDAATLVDVLLASSGIEPEIINEAEVVEVAGGVRCPIARTGHLIALKVLSRSEQRGRDDDDLRALVSRADAGELERARHALTLIADRGFARGKDLQAELEAAIARRRA
jgi:predicted nucleotidyltransferase